MEKLKYILMGIVIVSIIGFLLSDDKHHELTYPRTTMTLYMYIF